MAKKILLKTMAFLLATLIVCCAFFFALSLMDYTHHEITGSTAFMLGGGCVILTGVLMLVMNQLNEAYENAMGRKTVRGEMTAWSETCLFLCLEIIALIILLYQASDYSGLLSQNGRLQALFTVALIALTIAAIWFYARMRKRRDPQTKVKELLQGNTLQKDRRFTLMAEPVSSGFVVCGFLRGEIRKRDRVYVIARDGNAFTARIDRIETDHGKVNYAKNTHVTIRLRCRNRTIPPYAVITNIEPVHEAMGDNNTENPRIVAGIDLFHNAQPDHILMDVIAHDIRKGVFLLPCLQEEDSERRCDVTETMIHQTRVRFLSVTRNDLDEPSLPVFTDWEALCLYREVMENDHSATIVLPFDECVQILSEGYDGIVINPFGPNPFYVSKSIIRDIKRLTGDQNETKQQ